MKKVYLIKVYEAKFDTGYLTKTYRVGGEVYVGVGCDRNAHNVKRYTNKSNAVKKIKTLQSQFHSALYTFQLFEVVDDIDTSHYVSIHIKNDGSIEWGCNFCGHMNDRVLENNILVCSFCATTYHEQDTIYKN